MLALLNVIKKTEQNTYPYSIMPINPFPNPQPILRQNIPAVVIYVFEFMGADKREAVERGSAFIGAEAGEEGFLKAEFGFDF